MFGQLSRMFSGTGDPLEPANLTQMARAQLGQFGADPSISDSVRAAVHDAAELAELWTDAATDMRVPSVRAQAWSRAEWVEATAPAWSRLLGPVVNSLQQQSVADLTQASGEGGPAGLDLSGLTRMVAPMMGAMLGNQVASGIARLASEVLGGADIGLPLVPAGSLVLLPTNLDAFAQGLERPLDEVRLYFALRESAQARLFAAAPWLTDRIATALASAATGSTPRLGDLSELMGQIDPSDPDAAMRAVAERMQESSDTPEQRARESALETLLALVIGWVDDVAAQAAAGRLPAEPVLQEALRRRRATGGPAEQVFAEVAGVQLRPRRVREAAALWAKLRAAGGAATRDRVWSHPDFLPGSSELDDPDAFVAAFTAPEPDMSAFDELTRPRDTGDAEPDADDEAAPPDADGGDEPGDTPGRA